MKDFYIHMSDGTRYLVRAEKMVDVKHQIGQTRLINGGFMDVRIPETYKYVTINVEQITYIEEDDEI